MGLIDIARKSGQKLEYVFEKYNSDYSLYYSQITLQAENGEEVYPLNEATVKF